MEEKNQFNDLEKSVILWFESNYGDTNLIAQLEAARLKKREWTRVGFYVELEIPKNIAPVSFPIFGQENFPLKGPNIKSDDIEFGATTLLWGKNGYIGFIEMAAFGSFFKEHIGCFKLEGNVGIS